MPDQAFLQPSCQQTTFCPHAYTGTITTGATDPAGIVWQQITVGSPTGGELDTITDGIFHGPRKQCFRRSVEQEVAATFSERWLHHRLRQQPLPFGNGRPRLPNGDLRGTTALLHQRAPLAQHGLYGNDWPPAPRTRWQRAWQATMCNFTTVRRRTLLPRRWIHRSLLKAQRAASM